MSTDSLKAVQEQLNERGVRDVKFLFKREALGMPMTDLADDVANVLSKFYAGSKKVVNELPSEELSNI